MSPLKNAFSVPVREKPVKTAFQQRQLSGWQQFLNSPPHKIFIWDKTGTYRDCQFPNPLYGHFLAGTKLKGKRIFDVLDKPHAKAVFKGIKQALIFRRPSQVEWVWTTPSGTFHTVIRFFPILDLVMGIVTDQPLFQQQIPLNEEQTGKEPDELHRSQDFPLTLRERRIVEEVKLGKTNKEIAQVLQITPRTVKFHLSNIFDKLHISSREALQNSELALFHRN